LVDPEIEGVLVTTLVSQAYRESVRPPVDMPHTGMSRELDEFDLAIRGEAGIGKGALEAIRGLAVDAVESSRRNDQEVAVAPMVKRAGAQG
jgi:hypothetical protein